MYFLWLIRQKASKSFLLLHLLTNTRKLFDIYKNNICRDGHYKNEYESYGVKKSFFANQTLQKV